MTGATGQLGGATVEFLLDRVPAKEVAVLVRDPAPASHLAARGVDVRVGDYHDRPSLEKAFAGVDKLLLISAPPFGDVITQHLNAVAAAVRAGVRHVHYTATRRRADSPARISQVTEWDERTVAALRESGSAVTVLRYPLFLDALPSMLGSGALTTGLRVPAGQSEAALATRRDLAEANAAVLAGTGHEGRSYDLGGSEAVTMAEVAAIVTAASGGEVGYQDVSVREYVAERTGEGLPEPVAQFLAEWFTSLAAGDFAGTSGDLERLIGRKPQTVPEFLVPLCAPA
ncbi:NmrA family NAD(P)-binding protein [Umezawaea sp. Da 62-37]|uniref:NmrA family NAD(P)-binding protein n=1 Tax=Umezawaea sp. Da 62-37 TaxID=3075927 RepID=UPI0028F74A72|nr:NmrA family NAD(P)-binding protein [Umezawaea sp. Da 62-37]WNV85346.1 NmrA family NAD(P)-binding protein [Umezawaea sp. Da 62-37]